MEESNIADNKYHGNRIRVVTYVSAETYYKLVTEGSKNDLAASSLVRSILTNHVNGACGNETPVQ